MQRSKYQLYLYYRRAPLVATSASGSDKVAVCKFPVLDLEFGIHLISYSVSCDVRQLVQMVY